MMSMAARSGWLAALIGLLTAAPLSATPIFSEDFESGLGAWNVVHPYLTSAGGILRGNGDAGAGEITRGAMFRAAPAVAEVQFSFLRTGNSMSQNIGDTIEIGITPGQLTHDHFKTIEGTGQAVLFTADARQPQLSTSARFYVYDSVGNPILATWDISGQLSSGTWYDGLIRLEANNTVTFGYKQTGGANFNLSTGHPLPPGFAGAYVGATAFRVPPAVGTDGIAALDNITAFAVPEPATFVLCVLAGVGLLTCRRRWR